MMSFSDRFLVAFIITWLLLAWAFFHVGLPIWGWLWLAILLAVLLAELLSKVRSGRTITQRFRSWGAIHRVQAFLILAGMALAWVFLILHLGVK